MPYELLALVRENKILSALWLVFAAAFSFVVQQWFTSDQDVATIRALTTKIDAGEGDLNRAIRAIDVHHDVAKTIKSFTEELRDVVNDKALSPEHLEATKHRIVARLSAERRELVPSLAVLESLYFQAEDLRQLQARLVKEIEQLDGYLANRQEFMRTLATDPEKARVQAESIRENLDGARYFIEALIHGPSHDYILEKVRREHNDLVADANAKVKMHRIKSKLTLASAAYIGALLGGYIGRFFWRRRRKRQSESAGLPTTVKT